MKKSQSFLRPTQNKNNNKEQKTKSKTLPQIQKQNIGRAKQVQKPNGRPKKYDKQNIKKNRDLVMSLRKQGYTTNEIVQRTGLNYKTVKTLREKTKRKHGIILNRLSEILESKGQNRVNAETINREIIRILESKEDSKLQDLIKNHEYPFDSNICRKVIKAFSNDMFKHVEQNQQLMYHQNLSETSINHCGQRQIYFVSKLTQKCQQETKQVRSPLDKSNTEIENLGQSSLLNYSGFPSTQIASEELINQKQDENEIVEQYLNEEYCGCQGRCNKQPYSDQN